MRRVLGGLLGVSILAAAAVGWLGSSRGEVTAGGGDALDAEGEASAPELAGMPLALAARAGRAGSAAAAPSASPVPAAFAPAQRPDGPYAYGIVVDERGVPLPGAQVEAAWMDEHGNPGGQVAGRTTADDAGRYLLACPPDRHYHRRTLRASSPGRISPAVEIDPCVFQRIEARPAVLVEGLVLDAETGRAVAGAAVLEWAKDSPYGWIRGNEGWSSARASGPDGRFAFVAPREGLRVSAWQEGYAYTSSPTPVSPGAEGRARIDLLLRPAPRRVLRGRLRQGEQPVSGALVEVRNVSFGAERDPVESLRTDAEGRFEVGMVFGRDYALDARLGSLRAFDVVRGGAAESIDLELLPPRAVTGLLRRGGQPAAGVTVEMVRYAPREIHTTRTDGNGRYRFEDVRHPRGDGRLNLWVPANRQRIPVRAPRRHPGDAVADPVDLPYLRIRGHVRDETGRPVPRAVVDPRWSGVPVTADDGGAFAIDVAGSVSLHVSAPGYRTEDAYLRQPEEGRIFEVVLTRGGSLHGRVRDEQGRDVSGEVRLLPSSTRGASSGPWHSYLIEGRWSLQSIPDPVVGVRIEAEGYEPVEITDLRPDSVVPDVVLRRR